MQFSRDQLSAIETKGNSLIVSAAAGSGKTAVLVERVIRIIMRGESSIDRMWIMTFTKAAASEMRQKIEKAILDELEKNPDNEILQRQYALLPRANISTIHSACKRIIENNFHVLGIDPAVKIGDERELSVIFERILEDYVEEWYADAEQDEAGRELIDFLSSGRNDKRLFEVLHTAYDFCVEQIGQRVVLPDVQSVFDILPDDMLHQTARRKLEEAISQYERLLTSPDYFEAQGSNLWQKLSAENEQFKRALTAWNNRDFDLTARYINEIKFAAYRPSKDIKAVAEIAKPLREYAKELITDLRDEVFAKSAAEHTADAVYMYRMLDKLFEVVRQIDQRFMKEKRHKNMVSFSDLERFAVELLVERYDAQNDRIVPSKAALALQDEIDQIIVDEYQDTNPMQDLIFRALSKNETNIFMVGDVKQSIYKFRSACPELFMKKKNAAAPVGEGYQITEPSYLYLSQNFRSHSDILEFGNQVFVSCMTDSLGQVDYDENEQLHPGGLYPADAVGHIELDVIATDDGEEDDSFYNDIEREAYFTAQKIKQIVGTPFYDVKRGQNRPIEYGDIAILSRNAIGVLSVFETALRRNGIFTVNHNTGKNLLSVWEVQMLRAYLQVISNPYRDIPLITLLYSDFYRYSAEELAAVRARKAGSFYDALLLDESPKSRAVLQEINELRAAAVGLRSDEVLQMIMARTHILEKILSYPDGAARAANMRTFVRLAEGYEQHLFKGIFAFLNHLERLEQGGKIIDCAQNEGGTEQYVTLMSVHKSKGLEFPVCFVVNTETTVGKAPTEYLLTHRTLGPAIKLHYEGQFAEYAPLSYRLLQEQNYREQLSEQMRTFYVTLTRPKTHLYIVASERRDKLTDMLQSMYDYDGSHPSEFLSAKASYLKWILFALRGQQNSAPLYQALEVPFAGTEQNCNFTAVLIESVQKEQTGTAQQSKQQIDYTLAARLATARYSFDEQSRLPIKLSVSEIKGMREKDKEAAVLLPPHFGERAPSFLTGALPPNAIGNAVHKFMQFADFAALAEPNGIAAQREFLAAKQFLSAAELALVDDKPIAAFVAQPLFAEMVASDKLEKEKRFFFELPANEIYPETDERAPILLQGILDCLYEKDGKLCIVDYKTDRLSAPDDFVRRYAMQLRLYRTAVERIKGQKVDKLYLYSFNLDQVIEIS